MAGEDSKPEELCSELAGTHFTIRKINSDVNSGVQKVQNQFHGIPNGFPNQGCGHVGQEKAREKAPGGLQTLKISNNFGSTGFRNPPQAAKLDGGVSKLRTPRKRPKEGRPCKKAQGGEAKFLFHLDREKAYAAQSAKATPPPLPPSTTIQMTGPTSGPTTATERRGHPRHPPRAGMALRLGASTRMTQTMTRL
jgi:hypothetical protein